MKAEVLIWRIIAFLLTLVMLIFVVQHDPWRALGMSIILTIWIILKNEVERGDMS